MSEAPPLCVALFDRGPAWVAGRPTREQPYWDEHAAFIDGLTAEDRIMLAGPFADWTGALQILRGEVSTVEQFLAADPWIVKGVFAPPRVRPWLIWVDERTDQR
jgi:uncharacterized protein YciI